MKRLSRSKNVEAVVKNDRKHESLSKTKLVGREQVPKSRSSVELHLERKRFSDYHPVTDVWFESLPASPKVASPRPKMTDSGVDLTSMDEQGFHPSRDSPTAQTPQRSNSPARTLPVRTRKSSVSSTSTLLEKSNAVPITIIVTTADDDSSTEDGNDSPTRSIIRPASRLSRGISTTSLPAHFVPDRTRLMPPMDPQVDMRRLRKAREFEDIRNFLVGFLNTKGTQLPKTLRVKIMSIYGITDSHLNPSVVEKFTSCGEGPILDESLALNFALQGTEPTNREHMRILEMAFQCILPTAAPMASQDLLAARRKRMSMPLHSYTGSKTMSLHSVDEHSALSSKMSLATNYRSKQTLDSIISNRALLQSTRKPPNIAASISGGSSTSTTTQSTSFFSKHRPMSLRSSSRAQSVVNVPVHSSSASVKAPSLKRPQSLYRYITDPSPSLKPKSTAIPAPLALKQPASKPTPSRTESTSVKSSYPVIRPPIKSKPVPSPLIAPVQKEEQKKQVAVISDAPVPPPKSPLRSASTRTVSRTSRIDSSIQRPVSVIAPLSINKSETTEHFRMSTITPPVQAHPKTSRHTPAPITISRPQHDPIIVAPTPVSPAHRLTHKALTRSEASEIEKPFSIPRRKSSSTLSATSPVFSSHSQSPSPTGYETDDSVIVFPVHPGFAPLGREKCSASMQVEERRHTDAVAKEKWANGITVTVVEKNPQVNKLKKEKKEKRSSFFGSLKKSILGRA